MRGVGRLDALAEGGGRDVREGFHVDGVGGLLEGAGAEGSGRGEAGGRDGAEEDAAAGAARGVSDVGG